MAPISDQLCKLFYEHCGQCANIIKCINSLHANKAHNCTYWDIFTQVIAEVDTYVNKCVYNEFIRLQEENQRRMQND